MISACGRAILLVSTGKIQKDWPLILPTCSYSKTCNLLTSTWTDIPIWWFWCRSMGQTPLPSYTKTSSKLVAFFSGTVDTLTRCSSTWIIWPFKPSASSTCSTTGKPSSIQNCRYFHQCRRCLSLLLGSLQQLPLSKFLLHQGLRNKWKVYF